MDSRAAICIDCAKDASLRAFVQASAVVGPSCGICARRDVPCSRPEDHKVLSNLLRALIRFNYDEWDYNPHWGGSDSPSHLLASENPILEHQATSAFVRSVERTKEFLDEQILDDPYPAYSEGISVYAGFSDGIRLAAAAISRSTFGFLGSPSMSFLTPADFEPSGAELRRPQMAEAIGLRPENLSMAAGDHLGSVQGHVELVENLGADHVLYVRLSSGSRIVARVASRDWQNRHLGQDSEALSLYFNPRDLHFFDRENRRVEVGERR